ncbi:hypothetical protein EJ110_NYTH53023 [Nymphaea thermarum]|nr:hypothetical protein EJ110_NYTH53023 [Nymphaea thermarum]
MVESPTPISLLYSLNLSKEEYDLILAQRSTPASTSTATIEVTQSFRRFSAARRFFPAAAAAAVSTAIICFPAAAVSAAAIVFCVAAGVLFSAAAVALSNATAVAFYRATACCSLVLVMAEEMTPKIDVAFDTSHTTKSENLSVQVTSIRLNKDNYLSWSAALEIGITSHGRLPYITGEKPAPSKTDPRWATWALEDSQVKVWIISSVSADIQPLILRKSTSYDMWTVLARMYGREKRVLRTYQIKRSIYSLKQGDLSVASFYAALKTKWEELDYHVNDDWNCGSDHALYWEKEWMDRTFIFLGGLCDEFESIRSQILNCDEIPGIEEVDDRDSHMEGGSVDDQPTACDHMFGQVNTRKKKDVVEDVDVTNPNPMSSPDDPSPMNEELPIALRKGTRLGWSGSKPEPEPFGVKEPYARALLPRLSLFSIVFLLVASRASAEKKKKTEVWRHSRQIPAWGKCVFLGSWDPRIVK